MHAYVHRENRSQRGSDSIHTYPPPHMTRMAIAYTRILLLIWHVWRAKGPTGLFRHYMGLFDTLWVSFDTLWGGGIAYTRKYLHTYMEIHPATYVCIHASTYVYTYMDIYTHTSRKKTVKRRGDCTRTYVYIHTYSDVRMCIYTHTATYVCIYVVVIIRNYVRVYTHIQRHTFVYIHTYSDISMLYLVDMRMYVQMYLTLH